MRKLFCFLFLMIFIPAFAPAEKCLLIIKSEGINEYDPLIKAVTWVESKHGKYQWNCIEEAVGWFQITPIRVEYYNQLRGTNYKLRDFFDYELSKEMFLFYAAGKTFEQAAKSWNGSGIKTIEYWNKVKHELNKSL